MINETDITKLDFSKHADTLNAIIDNYNNQSDALEARGLEMNDSTKFVLGCKDYAWLVQMASTTLEYILSQQAIAAMKKIFAPEPEEKKPFDFSKPVTSESQFREGLKALFGDDVADLF